MLPFMNYYTFILRKEIILKMEEFQKDRKYIKKTSKNDIRTERQTERNTATKKETQKGNIQKDRKKE